MKRFYKEARIERTGARFAIVLDAQPIKTPARRVLEVFSEDLAGLIRDEWNAQEEELDMAAMPLTAIAYAAIDRVKAARDEIIEETAAFAGSDLLCYRAAEPDELVTRQKTMWDPFIDWVEERFGVNMVLTEGVIPVEQPQHSLQTIRKRVDGCNDMVLAALNSATKLTGSLVLALALAEGHADAPAVWAAAQLDEEFQNEQYGEDGEAKASSDSKFLALDAATRFMRAARA